MKTTKKWKLIDGDYDLSIEQRVISGRMTIKRYEVIRNFVKKYNREWRYPYGISPNGYAYNCGCSHDCCGHISSSRMSISFNEGNVLIKKTISYNY
jgi:hypothetical protein